jgi:hypothetical protein
VGTQWTILQKIKHSLQKSVSATKQHFIFLGRSTGICPSEHPQAVAENLRDR